jgi:DNA-binding MarR family transcriptional regulator
MHSAQELEDHRDATLTSTGHLLRRARQRWNGLWSELVSSAMTSPQFFVLSLLAPGDVLDQQEIGEQASLDKASCSYLIDRLDKLGLIDRETDPDNRRRKLIKITQPGLDALEAALPGHALTQRTALGNLTPAEQEQLNQLLLKLIEP